ncbi:MAG: hypothetical protein IPP69_11085 [Flavobacteriales bacterium]|nr:hypothetical protein [Flavobacteriales bacterium]
MSDERFFEQVKSSLRDYQPAVDASVYSGMRRKLWWSNFTKLSVGRFNMYYLLLLLLGSGTAVVLCNQSADAERCESHQPALLELKQPESTAQFTVAGSCSTADAQSHESATNASANRGNSYSTQSSGNRNNSKVDDSTSDLNSGISAQPIINEAEKSNSPEQGLTSPSSDPIVTAAAGETTPDQLDVEAEKSTKTNNGKRALKVKVPKDIHTTDN